MAREDTFLYRLAHGRLALVLISVCVLVGVFLGGRASGEFSRRRIAEARIPRLEPGDSLPRAMLYLNDGSAAPLYRHFSVSRPTVLLIFTTDCARCFGEAQQWRMLDEQYGTQAAFVGIATTSDTSHLGMFARAAGLRFPVLRAGPDFRRSLMAAGSPTIYVVNPQGRLLFKAEGDKLTIHLEEWIRGLK